MNIRGKASFFSTLFVSAVVAASGNMLLKQGAAGQGGLDLLVREPRVWAGLLMYGLSWLFYVRAMAEERAAVVVTLFTALSFVIVFFGATLVLGEGVGIGQGIGVFLILAGIVVCASDAVAPEGDRS